MTWNGTGLRSVAADSAVSSITASWRDKPICGRRQANARGPAHGFAHQFDELLNLWADNFSRGSRALYMPAEHRFPDLNYVETHAQIVPVIPG